MRKYSNKITLAKNKRGLWSLDVIKGCKYGLENNGKGCYGSCYAYSIANRYGYDFANPVMRSFKNENHLQSIIKKIKVINTNFIRIGFTGDPSECWEHTIDICNKIKPANKKIVIVTKHWNIIPDNLLKYIDKQNVYINTSISALDEIDQIYLRLNEFYRLKNICNSILRINSCDFNLQNKQGLQYHEIQKELFTHKKNIDNILRFNLNNPLVTDGVIEIEKVKFLNSTVYASVYNKNTHFGHCDYCPEKGGIN